MYGNQNMYKASKNIYMPTKIYIRQRKKYIYMAMKNIYMATKIYIWQQKIYI